MEKVAILLLTGLLASCVLEKNRNFELTVIHPGTERGRATLDEGTGPQPLGQFTSKAYFGAQDVTLSVQPLAGTRSVFLGYEKVLRYYGIDGNGETGTWIQAQPTIHFTVGADWKLVKVYLAPETSKAPLVLGPSGVNRRFLYQTNLSGQDQVWLGNSGSDPFIPVSPGLETGGAQPLVWNLRGWEGFPWVILGGSPWNTWVVSAATGTATRLSRGPTESTNRYVQYGDQGLYFLTEGQHEQGGGVLKRLDPVTGTVAVLWSPPGRSQTWIGPLTDTTPRIDDPVYLADSQVIAWEVKAPEPSAPSLSYTERFLILSQLEPSTGKVTPLPLGTTAPDLPTTLADTDPKTRRILVVGDWAGGIPFWIVGVGGVQKGTIPPGNPLPLWRARLTTDPGVILVPDGAYPEEHWSLWTVATPAVRLAEVPSIGDWRSPRIDFWGDWSLVPVASATYPDGTQIVTVTDATGAQDLALRPPGGTTTLLTGPRSGQEVP